MSKKITIRDNNFSTFIYVDGKKYDVDYLEFHDGIGQLEWEEVMIHPDKCKLIKKAVEEYETEKYGERD